MLELIVFMTVYSKVQDDRALPRSHVPVILVFSERVGMRERTYFTGTRERKKQKI